MLPRHSIFAALAGTGLLFVLTGANADGIRLSAGNTTKEMRGVDDGGHGGGPQEFTVSLPLSGKGVQAAVALSAPVADPSKGPFLLNSKPATGTKYGVVTLTNTGNGPLTLSAAPAVVKVGGAGGNTFSTYTPAAGKACTSGLLIPAGGTCVVGVQYVAKSSVRSTAHVSLTDSGAASAHQVSANFAAN